MKKIVYVDMDGVIADYDAHKHLTIEHDPNQSECKVPEGYFSDLPLIDGAVEALNELSKFYELYILSTPQWSNPNCWKEKRIWIEKHFGELLHKRIILTHNKGLLLGDYLIDDSTRNGVDSFKGVHIHFGQAPFLTWNQVRAFLVGRALAEEIIRTGSSVVYKGEVFR